MLDTKQHDTLNRGSLLYLMIGILTKQRIISWADMNSAVQRATLLSSATQLTSHLQRVWHTPFLPKKDSFSSKKYKFKPDL